MFKTEIKSQISLGKLDFYGLGEEVYNFIQENSNETLTKLISNEERIKNLKNLSMEKFLVEKNKYENNKKSLLEHDNLVARLLDIY